MPNFTPELLLIGFIYYVVFLFSTTCHEASHALVASIGGDKTAALGGQVTLNPLPHMVREPWGMVLIPILSFLLTGGMIGWASAPFDPQWERLHPRRSGWMALAGPVANYTLMLLAALGLRVGSAHGWFVSGPMIGDHNLFALTLFIFFSLNLFLGTFNLLPVPPLDGSTAVMLLMSRKQAQSYLDWLRGSSYAMVGLLIALVVFNRLYAPVETFATNLLLRGNF